MNDEERELVSYAVGSYSPAADARVLAVHQVGDYAGVWLRTPDDSGQGDDLVIAGRRGRGWTELTSGTASWTWTAFSLEQPDGELGVLAVLGEVDEPGTVCVRCGDSSVTRATEGRYWLAIFVGVHADVMTTVSVTPEGREQQF